MIDHGERHPVCEVKSCAPLSDIYNKIDHSSPETTPRVRDEYVAGVDDSSS